MLVYRGWCLSLSPLVISPRASQDDQHFCFHIVLTEDTGEVHTQKHSSQQCVGVLRAQDKVLSLHMVPTAQLLTMISCTESQRQKAKYTVKQCSKQIW